MAFSITWGLKYIYSLVNVGSTPPIFNFKLIAQFGPSLAALLLIFLTEGAEGIQRIIKSLANWRIGFWWLLMAATFEPLMFLIFTFFYLIKFDLISDYNLLINFSSIITFGSTFIIGLFYWGMSEEIGWRGWMLPKLQNKMSPFIAAIISALITTTWHVNPESFLADFIVFKEGTYIWGYYSVFVEQLVISVPMLLVIVFIFNNTKGSLLPMLLFHSASNSSYFWIKGNLQIVGTEFFRAAFLIALIVIVLIFSILVLNQKDKVTL